MRQFFIILAVILLTIAVLSMEERSYAASNPYANAITTNAGDFRADGAVPVTGVINFGQQAPTNLPAAILPSSPVTLGQMFTCSNYCAMEGSSSYDQTGAPNVYVQCNMSGAVYNTASTYMTASLTSNGIAILRSGPYLLLTRMNTHAVSTNRFLFKVTTNYSSGTLLQETAYTFDDNGYTVFNYIDIVNLTSGQFVALWFDALTCTSPLVYGKGNSPARIRLLPLFP